VDLSCTGRPWLNLNFAGSLPLSDNLQRIAVSARLSSHISLRHAVRGLQAFYVSRPRQGFELAGGSGANIVCSLGPPPSSPSPGCCALNAVCLWKHCEVLNRRVLTGTGSCQPRMTPSTGASMGLFFRLHPDLQMAIFDMLDFSDR